MKNKIVSYVTLMVAVLIGAQAQAALINFGNNWSTNYSASTAMPTALSGTSGTNSSVSFQMDTTSSSSVARGGVYNTFPTTTLGTNTDDAITYKFTVALYDPVTGTGTNTTRKMIFGVAGTNDKMSIAVCTGVATSGTSRIKIR